MQLRGVAFAVCLCAAATALGGCDADDEPARAQASSPRAVERVMRSYLQALREGRARQACRLLTPAMQARAVAVVGVQSCPVALGAITGTLKQPPGSAQPGRIESVRVSGERAWVRVGDADRRAAAKTTTGRARLERTDGEWKIALIPLARRPDPFARCVIGGTQAFHHGFTDPYWQRLGRAAFLRYSRRVCRRALATDATDPLAPRRIAGEVLRNMVRRRQLPPPLGPGSSVVGASAI